MGFKENDKIELDTALKRLGRFGKWQNLIYHAWGASSLIGGCIQLMIPVFITYAPDYHCNVPPPQVPPDEKCKQYENFTTHLNTTSEIIPCQNDILFYTNKSRTSIVTEFSLVCERDNLAELTMTLFVVGGMVGANFFSILSDKYGRKPVHLVSHILMALVSGFTALSNGVVMYAILRFLAGVILNGIIATGTVAACEVYPARYRAFGGIFLQVWWAFTMLLMDMLAYLIRDWRMLQLSYSLIPSVFIIAVFFYPETTPWLVANGKIDVAEELLRKGERWAGKNLFPKEGSFIKHEVASNELGKDGKEKSNVVLIMTNGILMKNLVIFVFIWFANVLIYWGISYMSTMLSGNLYLNFLYNAICEIPAIIICLFLLPRFGRRLPLFIYHAVTGILMIVIIFIPNVTTNGTNIEPLKILLTMIAKFSITASFNTIILYTTEVFPTNARNTGLGLTTFTARVAGIVSPFTLSVARKIPWLPGVVFGIIALLVAFLGLFLPETQNRPLPETVEEIKEWDRELQFYKFKVPKANFQSASSEYKNNSTEIVEKDDVESDSLKETAI